MHNMLVFPLHSRVSRWSRASGFLGPLDEAVLRKRRHIRLTGEDVHAGHENWCLSAVVNEGEASWIQSLA